MSASTAKELEPAAIVRSDGKSASIKSISDHDAGDACGAT